MGINDIVQEWLNFAEMDLETAQYLSEKIHKPPLEIICYHSHQSAEKYLKALIISYNDIPPKTHDLEDLLKICVNLSNLDFSDIAKECVVLTRYAVQPRYPLEIHIEESDMRQALKDAEKIREFIKNILQV